MTQLGALYERALAKPDHTLMSHVMHGGMPEGKVRSFEEIMPTMRVIILGGLQEPGHAAANACAGLLLDPEQAQVVAADPKRTCPARLRRGPALDRADRGDAARRRRGRRGGRHTDPCRRLGRDRHGLGQPRREPFRRARTGSTCSARSARTCPSASARISARVTALSRAMGEIALEEVFGQLPNLRLDHEP